MSIAIGRPEKEGRAGIPSPASAPEVYGLAAAKASQALGRPAPSAGQSWPIARWKPGTAALPAARDQGRLVSIRAMAEVL
jgi:hypothetical protein